MLAFLLISCAPSPPDGLAGWNPEEELPKRMGVAGYQFTACTPWEQGRVVTAKQCSFYDENSQVMLFLGKATTPEDAYKVEGIHARRVEKDFFLGVATSTDIGALAKKWLAVGTPAPTAGWVNATAEELGWTVERAAPSQKMSKKPGSDDEPTPLRAIQATVKSKHGATVRMVINDDAPWASQPTPNIIKGPMAQMDYGKGTARFYNVAPPDRDFAERVLLDLFPE